MSNAAIDWAIAQKITGPEKAVLIVLANRASADGTCFPGRSRIAFESGLSESTVLRSLRLLEFHGRLSIQNRLGSSNSYRLHLTELDDQPSQDGGVSLTGEGCQPDTGGVSAWQGGGVSLTPITHIEPKLKPKKPEKKIVKAKTIKVKAPLPPKPELPKITKADEENISKVVAHVKIVRKIEDDYRRACEAVTGTVEMTEAQLGHEFALEWPKVKVMAPAGRSTKSASMVKWIACRPHGTPVEIIEFYVENFVLGREQQYVKAFQFGVKAVDFQDWKEQK